MLSTELTQAQKDDATSSAEMTADWHSMEPEISLDGLSSKLVSPAGKAKADGFRKTH